MNTDPTPPPPPFKIIPKEYLLAGHPLPEDAKRIYTKSSRPEWRDTFYRLEPLPAQYRELVAAGKVFYASAQLDHPCFAGAPIGAREATEQATDEPASTELCKHGRAQDCLDCDAEGWANDPQNPANFQPQPEKEVKPCATNNPDAPAENVDDHVQSTSASNTLANVPAGGEGQYRMLEVGEVIREGDEYLEDEKWRKDTMLIGQEFSELEHCQHRRPIDAEQPAPSTPAPCAAKLTESAALIARVREAKEKSEGRDSEDAVKALFSRLDAGWELQSLAPQLADLAEQQQTRIAEMESNQRELSEEVESLAVDHARAETFLSAERQKREELEALIENDVRSIKELEKEVASLREELNWQNHRNSGHPTKGGFEFYINEEWTGLASAALDSDPGWHCALRKRRIDPDDERVRIRRVSEDDAIIAELSTLRSENEELRKAITKVINSATDPAKGEQQ